MGRRFQPLEVLEPSVAVATTMVNALGPLYSSHHGVKIDADAIESAVVLSHKGMPGRNLPDKAIDVLDEACCLATTKGDTEVTRRHIEEVLLHWRAPPWQRKQNSSMLGWLQQRVGWSRL